MRTLAQIKRKRRQRKASKIANMSEYQVIRKKFYASSTWRMLRAEQLKQQCWCEACLAKDRKTIATVVDHITPWCGDADLATSPNNLQSMCYSCHNAKTQNELRERGAHPLQQS